MSNATRIIERANTIRLAPKYVGLKDSVIAKLRRPFRTIRDNWWRAERSTRAHPYRADAPPQIRPEMLPRPEGMSRQVHRRLYRAACKRAGVPWRASA